MDKNAVGYFSLSPSGCSWYRVEHPMKALKRAGIETIEIPLEVDIDDSVISRLKSFLIYGAVPFSFEPVLTYFKEQGIKIIYDMDDALDLIDIDNPHFHMVKRDVWSVTLALSYADHVTVATEKLKEFVIQHYNYKGHITVVPNMYDPEEWKWHRYPHNDIRIGFAGSSTHVPDLLEVLPAVKELQAKYPITFYIMGFGSESYEEWFKSYRYISQPEATNEARKIYELLNGMNYKWIPFVHYNMYPKVLTELSLDIGICPLKSTPFNDCRSASKALEYNLSGALVLASDVIPYRQDPTSILTDTNDWYHTLEKYIIAAQERPLNNMLQIRWIEDNRNIDNNVDLLKSVYMV